jgi:hypothetical protein
LLQIALETAFPSRGRCTSALQSLTFANEALQGITGFLPTALLVSPRHSDPNPLDRRLYQD